VSGQENIQSFHPGQLLRNDDERVSRVRLLSPFYFPRNRYGRYLETMQLLFDLVADDGVVILDVPCEMEVNFAIRT